MIDRQKEKEALRQGFQQLQRPLLALSSEEVNGSCTNVTAVNSDTRTED